MLLALGFMLSEGRGTACCGSIAALLNKLSP